MGHKTSKQALQGARTRALQSGGTSVGVSGRYHHPPSCIEDDYEVTCEILGSGFGGDVVLAYRNGDTERNGTKFAVKSFKLRGLGRSMKQVLETEVDIFLRLDHPHVCRLFDIYETDKQLHMVMECLEGGELLNRLNRKHRFSERTACTTTQQMLAAISYIHSLGIAHCDVKMENFLYDAPDSNHLKMIDFGFCQLFQDDKRLRVCCGTLSYMAPEVILKDYTNKCDMYSLGVIVFVLLVGHLPITPCSDQEDWVLSILNGDIEWHESKWKHVSPLAREFVSRLLERDPDKRMSATEALAHRWLQCRGELATESHVDEPIVRSLEQFAAGSKFRRACLRMMAWSLTNEEASEVRQAFMEFDKSKCGRIKLCDFKAVLEQRFKIEDEEVKRIFDALDTTNNDEVPYSEFLAAMMSSRIEIHEDLIRSAFSRFDEDKAGYITSKSLRNVLGESMHGGDIDHFVRQIEVRSDGRVSFDDFMTYLCRMDTTASDKEAAGLVIDAELQRLQDVSGPAVVTTSSLLTRRAHHAQLSRTISCTQSKTPTIGCHLSWESTLSSTPAKVASAPATAKDPQPLAGRGKFAGSIICVIA